MGRRNRKFGFSWSARRAVGISGAKGRMSRKLGIPLSRSGRQRMIGRKVGCCIPLLTFIGGAAGLAALVA